MPDPSEDRLPLVPSLPSLQALAAQGPPLARLLLTTGIRWGEVRQIQQDEGGIRLRGGRRLPGPAPDFPIKTQGFEDWLQTTPLAKRFQGARRMLTPQVFRHGFAVACLESGMDLRVLTELMGHADLRTTQMYIAIALRDCRQIYRQTHPLHRERKPQANLEVKQVLKLLAAISKPRDALIARLGYASGLRADELVSFTPADLDPDEDKIFVRTGKGDQDRYALVDPETMERLRAYAQTRPFDERVFATTRDQVWRLVKRAAGIAGLEFPDAIVSPHGLRHACASHCHQAGMSPEMLARLLGHSVLRNTLLYVHVPWTRVTHDLTTHHPWH